MTEIVGGAKVASAPYPATKRRGLSLRAREEIIAYILISPWIIGFLVFTLGALIFSLVISLYNTDLLTRGEFIGLGNYHELFFDDPLFWKSARVTTLFTLGVVPLQVGL